jgi:hypothetical protein
MNNLGFHFFHCFYWLPNDFCFAFAEHMFDLLYVTKYLISIIFLITDRLILNLLKRV